MTQVLFGSLVLSLIHAAIPNHWLPILAVSRAEGWGRSETLVVTGLTGAAHSSSTILIGVLVGMLGYGLSGDAMITAIVPPVALIGLGIVYLILDRRGGHAHGHGPEYGSEKGKMSKRSIVASLCVAMFFSPCLEIEAYYLTAGFLGWQGIVAVSVTYLIVTTLGMIVLVDLARRGTQYIKSEYLEHHEYRVTGLVLVGLGVLALFVEI